MSITPSSHQQYLTFILAGEEYAVGVMSVQEIRPWHAVTVLPNAPAWMLGVLDLRGVVVPVMDLRRRFDLEPAQIGPSTVVIVLRVQSDGAARTVGLVVDAISEVYDIDAADCRSLPDIGGGAGAQLVQGLAQADGKTLILIDPVRLASPQTH
jgi:purine-binding chemotaxis protein CheW